MDRDSGHYEPAPWSVPGGELLKSYEVSPGTGLTPSQAHKHYRRFGPNVIQEKKPASAWSIFISQFDNLVVLILAGASVLSFFFGQWLEGVTIGIALIINVVIGFFMELKATRSLESLRQMTQMKTRVLRNGQSRQIPAKNLVPGDIVEIEAGDVVPADLRLVEASRIEANESVLTGESFPVQKDTGSVDRDAPLAERGNMLYNGTSVTRGSGKGLVVATGMDTELGRIASLAEEAGGVTSPLEKRLDKLGYRLILVTGAIGVLVLLGGILAGTGLLLAAQTAVALAVAAIPEGLPVVSTIALAYGMRRMAHRNALVNRLSSVETLGSTSVICTDKTGTLTENRMTVVRLVTFPDNRPRTFQAQEQKDDGSRFIANGEPVDPSRQEILSEAVRIGVLCNSAWVDRQEPGGEGKMMGDPMETALLQLGDRAGISRKALLDEMPEVREVSFDPDVKMMATIHEAESRYYYAVKGAPEAVFRSCAFSASPEGPREKDERSGEIWEKANNELAGSGLRVLAVAGKTSRSPDEEPYRDLTLYALVGFLDPPRDQVKESIDECRHSGIRVIMVTGDQAPTALNIGQSLGIGDGRETGVVHGSDLKPVEDLSDEQRADLLRTSIFARVNPEQKLNIIGLHQEAGAVVAMTGDGVNDAPALKRADIGIAMGMRGTQVAREASDIVLRDDAFPTIVMAIEQGRAIFENIRKFIIYLLSGNVGEILIVLVAMALGIPLPITPLQILYLNMISDVFPALALAVGRGDPSLMDRPPRPSHEPIITRGLWLVILGYGVLIASTVLASFFLAREYFPREIDRTVTISFLTLAFARLWHVFNMRHRDSGIIRNEITRNPYVWGALALSLFLLLAAAYLPGISRALSLFPPEMTGWLVILGMSAVPLIVVQVLKSLPPVRKGASSESS